jgi:fructose/tagatose bisphosphate aldolase
MTPHSVPDMLHRDRASYELTNGHGLFLKNPQKFSGPTMDLLVWDAVFGESEDIRNVARWIIRRGGLELGAVPASTHELYEARGRKECGGFTVPAINIRGMSYDVARAVIRAAKRLKAGAFIFELGRSEMSYTDQHPGEFAAVMLAAAIREGFEGPVFIQGDHYQANPKKFAKNYFELELQAIRDLCQEAVSAGHGNIDIDSSTLVDLSRPDLREQQRSNFEVCAELAAFIRSIEPPGMTVSLGGEIGEVGKKNSTPEELAAFMDGFLEVFGKKLPGKRGLSKISVNTGTSHGGVVLPDGTVAQVAIDFETLRNLSTLARDRYGMGGAVQHGASTLPADAFHKFVECETVEVHLATEFQNMMFENAAFPRDLKEEIYKHLRKTFSDEKKPADTDEQFIYKTRKKAFGAFKRKFWELPAEVRTRIGNDLENKFAFLFEKLNVQQTADLVKKKVNPVRVLPPVPPALAAAPKPPPAT